MHESNPTATKISSHRAAHLVARRSRVRRLFLCSLVALLLPSWASAQIALIRSRDSSALFDVSAGATSDVSRLRVIDTNAGAVDFGFAEGIDITEGNDDGLGNATGTLVLNETVELDLATGAYVFEATRVSNGSGESLFGDGFGQSQLNNDYEIRFDVVEPVAYTLEAELDYTPSGPYDGRVIFRNVSPAVPAILNDDVPFGPTTLSGTLGIGTYRLHARGSGTALSTGGDPAQEAGSSSYAVRLELALPEPSLVPALGLGTLLLARSAARRQRRRDLSPRP